MGGFLLLAFGFGLAAIFTPCVFPMIPITVSFFLNRQSSVFQAVVFSLGIVVLFSGLGLITTAGLGAANARNAGANASRGEVLVFCDAHITAPHDWLARMEKDFSLRTVAGLSPAIASMADPHAVGYGQTWNDRLEAKWLPKPSGMATVPLLPGGCQAFRQAAFAVVGGYDRGFKVWGHEDEEISFKMWLFGYSLFVDPDIKVLHLFRPAHPYPVSVEHVNYNFLRMACSHLSRERLAAAFSLISGEHNF
ncbi:MAG: glycosyltransferase, partial [Acidobacteria bacterium]|nr:glycosyltransferase [Acidobacteriota bacterium]